MSNITIIIPVHEFNEKVSKYLLKAIESVDKQEGIEKQYKTLIVCPENIEKEIAETVKTSFPNFSVTILVNTGKTDYQSQVNLGVKTIFTDYFAVLEFDDEIGKTYIKTGEKYIASYPEIDVFLTMMIEVNEKDEGLKLTNEFIWSQQMVGENGEMGYLNPDVLKQYSDFKLSGAIIKKSEFLNVGKYKSNIKLSFMYEFLMRALNNTCKIFSIPKIGYKHLSQRDGSLFDDYQKNMPAAERKFWFDVAVKESNFINDRNIDLSRLQKIVVEEK